jgi:DNA (cytosine-5)-methyltransferase 1
LDRARANGEWRQRSNYSDSGAAGTTAEERGRTERPLDAPSLALTSKGFQWACDLSEVVVRTGNNTMRTSRRAEDMVPQERPVTDSAPTLDCKVGSAWKIAREGDHVDAPMSWKLRAGTNERDCSRPVDEPAPTIRYGARLNDVSWVLRSGQSVAGEGRAERSADDPSLSVISRFDLCEWVGERPSTSVNCDPRVAEPGRHDPDESGSQYGPQTVRVSVEEAAALQSFPSGYPWEAAGTRTAAFKCVGNGFPPLQALHVLAMATGRELP